MPTDELNNWTLINTWKQSDKIKLQVQWSLVTATMLFPDSVVINVLIGWSVITFNILLSSDHLGLTLQRNVKPDW